MAMLNTENFLTHLQKFTKPDCNFLLAVSGGVDSMVLLDLFLKSGLNFEVAHVNYRLRGDSSDQDQKLVERICKKNRLKLHIYQVSEPEKAGNSIQLWAREIRYRFFREIAAENNLDYIVTAHHLNDQLETFLINLSRGTGIRGLTGIPDNENAILRPLNVFSREDVLEYAKNNAVQFREDETNSKNDYLRNRIRHRIVPELLNLNENFLDNFGRTIGHVKQAADYVSDSTVEKYNGMVSHAGDDIFIDKQALADQTELFRFEILRKFGFENSDEISKIFKAETGKVFHSKTHHLTVDRAQLIITKTPDQEGFQEEILTETEPDEFFLPGFNKKSADHNHFTEWLFNRKTVQCPLRIRMPKSGDRFYPVGFSGSKTVAKFLKDEKMPIFARQEIRLLCDAEDRVLGVIPLRQDRRFCATADSENCFKIKF